MDGNVKKQPAIPYETMAAAHSSTKPKPKTTILFSISVPYCLF